MTKEEKKKCYKKSEVKYAHLALPGKILLGVDKELAESRKNDADFYDEVNILFDAPSISYPFKFWESYFLLNGENRQIISNILYELEQTENKTNYSFNSYYWSVFCDFLLARYDLGLYGIAREIEGTGTIKKNKEKTQTYNRLEKLQKCKNTPRKETITLLKEICAYHLTTYDLIRTGKGIMYSLADYTEEKAEKLEKKYTMAKIRSTWNEHIDWDLKTLILELTGLKENDLIETPIRIATQRKRMDEKTKRLLFLFMEKLQERQ